MTRGAPCSFKCKQGLQGRKRQGRRIDGEKDERSAMQFQMKVGAPGKKTSGAPNWRRKGREGRHAVSRASKGSREENIGAPNWRRKRTRDAPCSFKWKKGFQGRKRQGRQIDGEKDERGAMQFQMQVGDPGKKTSGRQIDGEKDERVPCSFKCKQGLQGRKHQGRQIDGEKGRGGAIQFQVHASRGSREETSGAPNWRRKGREMCHAVSSASRGSRNENVRGAKLTEKRTRGAPCSFKCKQELQARKRQGRQIDGEKDERGAMQFQIQAGAPGKKTSGAPNWRRNGREMRHAVSSASRGSREENVRGAKETEKRTKVTLGGAEMTFENKMTQRKKMLFFWVDFWPKRELNCVFYVYQIQNFFRQGGSAPYTLPKSLTMCFYQYILCEFLILTKKEWNCVFKAYQIQNFLIGKGALPLATAPFNHVFLNNLVWVLSIFTKKEWNNVSQCPSNINPP